MPEARFRGALASGDPRRDTGAQPELSGGGHRVRVVGGERRSPARWRARSGWGAGSGAGQGRARKRGKAARRVTEAGMRRRGTQLGAREAVAARGFWARTSGGARERGHPRSFAAFGGRANDEHAGVVQQDRTLANRAPFRALCARELGVRTEPCEYRRAGRARDGGALPTFTGTLGAALIKGHLATDDSIEGNLTFVLLGSAPELFRPRPGALSRCWW